MQIFLLRGLVREKRHWHQFNLYLQEIFPNAAIKYLEIDGVGAKLQRESQSSIEKIVKALRSEHLVEIQASDSILVALSLGGMIAAKWSELYPMDFKEFVLINSSFKGYNSLTKRLRPKALLTFIKIFFSFSIESRESQIIRLVANNKANADTAIATWVDIQRQSPVTRQNFLKQLYAAATYSPSRGFIPSQRFLFLCGKADKLCSYKCSIENARRWSMSVKIHPSAGHDLPIDDPSWLAQQIYSWSHIK